MNSRQTLSRRGFIKRAAIISAAPLILRSGLWAADNAPSKDITMGFIGMGRQNLSTLLPAFNRPGVRILAVCDVDTTRRKFAKDWVEKSYADKMASGAYKGCDAYNDFRDLIARKDIDAVCIATPDHWHALCAIAALKAGKDVYCEKPMAHTVLEGRAMVNATRKNNRVFQVGSMQRSMQPEFLNACELVRNGAIGKISCAYVNIGDPAIPCTLPAQQMEPGLDWNMWLGMAPDRPYSSVLSPRGVHTHFPDWRLFREYACGMIGDWGGHHFDIVQWALGMDESGPVEFIPSPDGEKAKRGVSYKYANGVQVFHQDKLDNHRVSGILVVGDKGRIEVNRGEFKYWEASDLINPKVADRKESVQLVKDLLPANATRLYKSSDHYQDFLNAIKTRKPPICDVETGHRTATICNLVGAVYYNNQGFKWDPKTESFSQGGKPEWLTREYRAPWKLES